MPRSLLVLLLCVCACAPARAWVRSTNASADTYIDAANPGQGYITGEIRCSSADASERVPLVAFRIPALGATDVLDSARIVAIPSQTALSSFTVRVYKVERLALLDFTTWQVYDYDDNAWQIPGAWGDLDIDKTSDWGKVIGGQSNNGVIDEWASWTGKPATATIARGTGFTAFVRRWAGLQEDIILIWHDNGANGTANPWTIYDTDGVHNITLEMYGHTVPPAGGRRRVMMED